MKIARLARASRSSIVLASLLPDGVGLAVAHLQKIYHVAAITAEIKESPGTISLRAGAPKDLVDGLS